MAMNVVLGTAELLISILQELDIKTLLLARRVSQQWLETVQSSPDLQEILYYKHRPKAREDTRYLWNPAKLLLEPSSPNGLAADLPPAWSSSTRLAPTTINPLFIEKRPHSAVHYRYPPTHQGQHVKSVAFKALLSSPCGSWQVALKVCQTRV
jgi:hypothetical protein